VNTLRAQLIFPSKPNFDNLFELPKQNPLKKLISSTPWLWNCEINSIRFDLLRAFQQHRECTQILLKKWFNNNSFHTIDPKSLKPSWCTPTHWELFEDTKSVAWSTMVWNISAWQNKTNYLVSKVDLVIYNFPIYMCKVEHCVQKVMKSF